MKRKVKNVAILTVFLMVFSLGLKAEPGPAISKDEPETKNVAKKVFPSVVKVEAKNRVKKVATGVVVDKKGHVVTTALISPRDEKISVITSDGKKLKAEFLGMDSETHLALLRVKEEKLTPITLGNVKELSPGSWIGVVTSSPENTPAITQGIVSSISEEKLRLNIWIIRGSSGSPVVNKEGHMVGILRGIYFDDQPVVFEFREKEMVGAGYVLSKAEAPSSGMALAVPVNIVKSVADEIKEKGKVERGWLGVTIADTEDGKVRIVGIEKESPAELAKLTVGDIILVIDGKKITKAHQLVSEIRNKKPGKTIAIEIERKGEVLKMKAKLGEYPKEEAIKEFELRFPRLFPPFPPEPPELPKMPEIKTWPERFYRIWESRKFIGVYLEEMGKELSAHFGVKEGKGLFVSKFSEDSPAEKAGLKVGDVIIKADGERVETVSQLSKLIQGKKKGEKIKIEFIRDKKIRSAEVEVGEEERGGIFGGVYGRSFPSEY
ncbi:MAG: PDZ domain-containing protein [Candidatus Aminicenantaceae bacterium]